VSRRGSCLVAACVFTLVNDAIAQRIAGVVRDESSTTAVSGAVVSVVDSMGRAAARSLSNERGEFALRWPEGAARLRIIRIGFSPVTLSLPAGRARDTVIQVTMRRLPVSLGEVRVAVKPVCAARGNEGALHLWDQARAALLNSIVARTTLPTIASNLTYQRDLDPQSRRVLAQRSRIKRRIVERPFSSALAAVDLAAHGYVTVRDGEQTFHGPDPEVLFDDSFTETHCFGIQTGDEAHRGLVALTFEPRQVGRSDSIVDVRGELWIDPQNSTLVQLNFRYTGVDDAARRAGIGGILHFESLRNGIVFIDHWSIAVVTLRQVSNSRVFRVARMNESGGIVLTAEWPDGTRYEGRPGAVSGVVSESGGSHPARSIVVAIEGVDSTSTDQRGRFSFGPLPPGLYSLRLSDTTYQAYTAPRMVRGAANVGLGDTASLSFEMPAAQSALARICPDQRSGRSTILGWIHDSSRAPPPDLRVEGTWLADISNIGGSGAALTVSERTETMGVDASGRFRFCDIPYDRKVLIRVASGRLPIADTSVTVGDSASRFVEWHLAGAFRSFSDEGGALTGRVVSEDGNPIPGADVSVAGNDRHGRTDSLGHFRLYGLPRGKQFVQIRRIGFRERLDTVTLRAGREIVRDFALERSPVVLDTMRTTSPIVAYRKPMLQEFEMRRHSGTGRYIAEEVLRKNDQQSIGQFLGGRLGGMNLVGYKSALFAGSIRNQGGTLAIPDDSRSPRGCWIAIYEDGVPLYTGAPSTNAPDLHSIRIDRYAGIEFYPGGASMPARFNSTKEANCGVLLLWTREK
jgi:hypothetical protein